MQNYAAPLRDLRFVLSELLPELSTEPVHPRLDAETLDQVLAAAAKFATQEFSPLNEVGDRHGCSIDGEGNVRTPAGFREAYRQFSDHGWAGIACDPAFGGEGLSSPVYGAIYEMFCGANMSLAAYGGMSHAAYVCLESNATQEQKAMYLPKLTSGEWAGTMCLTESHCGTDLGLLRTTAQPTSDGSYQVSGTKIFISGGDHDLTTNIVHLVLARLPGAPSGVKGISLFIVPKFLPDAAGLPGLRNAVACSALESKMGIHGNATCTMNFEGAKGWLLGEPHRGLAGMFIMMNHARLVVGINAIGLMEAAYQKAVAYAKDRRQGRRPGSSQTSSSADPIIQHADVRRMLLTQRSYVEGARALALWVSHLSDARTEGATDLERSEANHLVELLTPVVKAISSDLAVESTLEAMQVFGGHGYIRANGVEQNFRDARIIGLYEGTNGVQAMDLLGRKVVADGGRRLGVLLSRITDFAQSPRSSTAIDDLCGPLIHVAEMARELTEELLERASSDPDAVGAAAQPHLRLIGMLSLAFVWASAADVSLAKCPGDDPVYAAKVMTARFFFQRLLPQSAALSAAIRAGSASTMALGDDHF